MSWSCSFLLLDPETGPERKVYVGSYVFQDYVKTLRMKNEEAIVITEYAGWGYFQDVWNLVHLELRLQNHQTNQ